MRIAPFKLERYFAAHEFTAKHLLSCSDCEPLSQAELLALADDETRALWAQLSLGYTESAGHPLLRREIAAMYERATADDVLVCAPEEGILISMNVLLNPGDHVIAPYPGYQSLSSIAAAIGCQMSRWEPRIHDGRWQFAIDELLDQIQPHTKLIVINLPHNPTGATISHAAYAALMDAAASRGIYVFADEMYRLLEYDPAQRLPAGTDLYERAITLSGMSKAFGLAGLRLGWLVIRDRTLWNKLAAFKDYTTICSSAPSEILSLIGLRAKDTLVQRNMTIIQENLIELERFFAQHDGLFQWPRPAAGSVTLAALRTGDIDAMCQALLAKKKAMLLPGSAFDYPGNYFRLGLGRQDLAIGLEHWSQYLISESP